MGDDFPAKLELVLKALAISRGRLAADMGVDKSVVSRWLSGLYRPSGENLSQLTRLVAARRPGFTGLDWDRDLSGLSAMFGAHAPAPAAGVDEPAIPNLEAVRATTARIGNAFEGHWDAWRGTFQRRGVFARDTYWIRRRGDFLTVSLTNNGIDCEGWLLPGDGRSYLMMHNRISTLGMVALYSGEGLRARFMDGIVMGVTALASRAFVAAPYVMMREADLIGDPGADQRFYEARAARESVFGPEAVPPDVLERLRAGQDHDPQLHMVSDGSLTRSSTKAETEAAAEATAAFLRDGSLPP